MALTSTGCWVLGDDEPCLVCEFNTEEGVEFYERVCSDDEAEREAMRTEAQEAADAVGAVLNCKEQ